MYTAQFSYKTIQYDNCANISVVERMYVNISQRSFQSFFMMKLYIDQLSHGKSSYFAARIVPSFKFHVSSTSSQHMMSACIPPFIQLQSV